MPEETLSKELFDQDRLEEPPSIADSNKSTREEDNRGRAEPEDEGERVEREDAALKHVCSEIYARISAFLQAPAPNDRLRDVQRQTQTSLKVIREALDRYTLEEISLSYNGGKDCLVLLILYLCALATHSRQTTPPPELKGRLQSVYIVPIHPFPEVDAFVTRSSEAYHLAVARYPAPMRSAFEAYLRDRRRIKAVLVGTRRTDPNGADLTHFDPTDGGWPAFMRVHPVIDWKYAEVWAFLRHLQFPYCPLYDQGYTSLGGTTDTHPNPALKTTDCEDGGDDAKDSVKYKPAYELHDDSEERLGRDR